MKPPTLPPAPSMLRMPVKDQAPPRGSRVSAAAGKQHTGASRQSEEPDKLQPALYICCCIQLTALTAADQSERLKHGRWLPYDIIRVLCFIFKSYTETLLGLKTKKSVYRGAPEHTTGPSSACKYQSRASLTHLAARGCCWSVCLWSRFGVCYSAAGSRHRLCLFSEKCLERSSHKTLIKGDGSQLSWPVL